MGLLRKIKKSFYKRQALKGICEYKSPLLINYPCLFNSNTYLGRNTSFNGIKIEGNGRVQIGDNFHSGKDCLIFTSVHNYDYGSAIPYDNTYIDKEVIIEDNVWIGTRVIIMGGVRIGEGAIVQAGAVVVSDIPKYAIAGGNPAKEFKKRDIDHYENLKSQKKFY